MLTAPDFPIVGVGASAGGVEALEGLFGGMPADPGLAIVIVTHLSVDRESLLHEIVARWTGMAVHVATDGMKIEKEHVYVMPAGVILGIENRCLSVRRPDVFRRERKPIDIFFGALAVDCGESAVGIVLSGGDGDGALGIKAIKERGGFTLAQAHDGHGPQYPDMPDSAIATGLVDLPISVEGMGVKLAEFARSLPLLDEAAAHESPDQDGATFDQARAEICAILRNQVGHDFGGYKSKTFVRRVQRRMQVRQLDTIGGYVELLRQEPTEVGALFRDLLINVTNFFRDSDAFETLAALVIPQLFEGCGADETVRVWVPGCATGEEVYSIGILLCEAMDQLTARPRIQLFATDIDERALGVARAGRYPEALLDSVSPERRKRFFVADGGSYVVSKEVRDLCIFSPHSVIRDPPFSRIDLVSCRNLLIYLGADVQSQVIPTFHYALRPDGYLFLGMSENISQFNELFTPLDKKQRIFRRRPESSGGRLPFALSRLRPGQVIESPVRQHASLGGRELRRAVESQVLDRFAPPHVVVNQDGEIVFYSTRTGKYLEAAAGLPTRQILAIARKGLRLDMRTALREALETGNPVKREGVSVENEDGRVQMIALTIAPIINRDGGEPLFLILFADEGPTLTREEALSHVSMAQEGAALQLERELRDTRERLQSLIEEYETALEELKSSNEELVSVNEELQSSNEELEASKEELQSVNEEMQTVNADLNNKVQALDQANSDLKNLFDSTDVATLFLDRHLVIRSFTPAMTRIFNFLPGDRGRPLSDLATRLTVPGLAEGMAEVLAGSKRVERRADDPDGKAHYLVRLSPYRDTEQEVQGVVASFIDVSEMMDAEARQSVLVAELQHRTRNLLAIAQSIAHQTLDRGPQLTTFELRLAALGRVQGLISGSEDDRVDLGDVVRLELNALGGADSRITISGPPIPLRIEYIQMFALALHELATNALKHGALTTEGGRLAVSWVVSEADDPPVLCFVWHETGLDAPPDQSRRGYGRKLIEKALAYSLRAKTNLQFGTDGIEYRLDMPLVVRP